MSLAHFASFSETSRLLNTPPHSLRKLINQHVVRPDGVVGETNFIFRRERISELVAVIAHHEQQPIGPFDPIPPESERVRARDKPPASSAAACRRERIPERVAVIAHHEQQPQLSVA